MNGEEIVLAVGQQLKAMEERINQKFADVDKKFGEVDKRFDSVDKQFREVNTRLALIEGAQKLLNERVFQTEQDIVVLKQAK